MVSGVIKIRGINEWLTYRRQNSQASRKTVGIIASSEPQGLVTEFSSQFRIIDGRTVVSDCRVASDFFFFLFIFQLLSR